MSVTLDKTCGTMYAAVTTAVSKEVSEMSVSRIFRSVVQAMLGALGGIALGASAEVFYGGETKGSAGDFVNLTVNARAGTVLEGIDIVPDIGAVAGTLIFRGFLETTGLTEGGSALCLDSSCSVFYLPEKTFAQDTLLATIEFVVDSAAPIGLVNFDPGVVVGVVPLPIPAALQFEVLAIPEPLNWMLLLAGLAVLVVAVPRCRRAQERFGARRAAVLRASRRWAGLPRREPSR